MQTKTWRTAISRLTDEGCEIGGYKVQDMMRNLDFLGSLFVLFQQRLPRPGETKLLNAVMISVMDHSIVASSAVTRIVSASGVPLQACVAAGLLTVGDVHGGAGQEFSRKLEAWVAEARAAGRTIAEQAELVVAGLRERRERIQGYGHPLHTGGDARVDTLIDMAKELDLYGPHLELACGIGAGLERATGRRLPLNIDGVIAGIVSDLGFDWRLGRIFIMLPRTAGLAAHAVEEATRERGWRKIAGAEDIDYDGPPLSTLPRADSAGG